MAKRKSPPRFERMIGQSSEIKIVFARIRQAAATDVPVLILGETGTGKDLVAKAIHSRSKRADGVYIPVHLGAVPANLVASELFGHEKGVFTGATETRQGKFELGNGGTVFLDEIGTISERVQISLLRLLEQHKFHRLGGQDTFTTDVRLIAASNADLYEAVQKGTFREDLYYRLDVFRIDLPPLRQRRQDIELLVRSFLKSYCKSFGKAIKDIPVDALSLLQNYHWPGNIRELKNVIQRAVLVCEGDALQPRHLPPRFHTKDSSQENIVFKVGTTLAEMEQRMIRKVLMVTGNNRKKSAELLGISRRTLYNKLEKYGLMSRDIDV
ncbi:MAG: sigma-54 dependent transcriptional regulator [Candidatus Pacebacteria bacterium]|nr:sigma-54 dependent transcriptional regulator [Candidatus Paceibacterota bacterium]